MFKGEINAIVEKIGREFEPNAIIVFGSAAKNTATENSDIDLMVILETDLAYFERTLAVRKSIGVVSTPIDVLVFTPAEIEEGKRKNGSVISEALRTGKIVYGTVRNYDKN